MPHPLGSPADLADLENPPPLQPGTEFGRRLPSNWVANMTWLFDFSRFAAADPAFVPADGDFNHAAAIDTHLVDPLATLPTGSFGAASAPLLKKRNLAFRNLARGRMLGLPSGQQMASAFIAAGLDTPTLTADQLRDGNGGIVLEKIAVPNLDEVLTNTPLWFYVLREAEFNNHRLGPVGGRIVAETFHRAMQASMHSILADAGFKPSLGPGRDVGRCQMEDLLHHAFGGRPDLLSPLG